MTDFLFRGSLADLDATLNELIQIEAERQVRKLILIPSESQAPLAVREALSCAFQNIYAEGYPDEDTRWMTEEDLVDYKNRLAHFRRYSDPRYYKGVEYADIAEALARRRCAETFAANGISADDIYVNVQALSGAPANNAVYHALVEPGGTIMGMNLLHGGHLTHGSSVNRSGKFYRAIHYSVDPQTERIDYDQVEELARTHKPKFIIAGYSSYPWAVDWERFRRIADTVGAFLFADIAHVAGLVAAGVYPSPLGYAHVITFTTHKSLCGPRGACILTTDASLARKIDRAVFPGEQGGPHVNTFVAMALAFKLAQTEQFKTLQKQVVQNCKVFTQKLKDLGFRIPYGGTDTHMMNLDCSTIVGEAGVTLSGDQAARILDIAGIVVNRNTIPGDLSAADPSGIRMGTHWVTQRGFKEQQMEDLAHLIGDLLHAITPYAVETRKGWARRAKVDFTVLEETKMRVREMALSAGMDFQPNQHGYPHFYYLDDPHQGEWASLEIGGERVRAFLNFALSSDVDALKPGESQVTSAFTPHGHILGRLYCLQEDCFRLVIAAHQASLLAAWLRDLSDGYVSFDEQVERKLPGPVWVAEGQMREKPLLTGEAVCGDKPYFIGQKLEKSGAPLADFTWQALEAPLRRTPIFETHKRLGAKLIPFAGWEMPVWYTSVLEEHLAVRHAAGLFDVAHMGVYQAEGPHAAIFLDSVAGNDISGLEVGESCYTHFLTPDAEVIDDLLVYRRGREKFLIVVNAANDDKDWAWLNAVKAGEVRVSRRLPWGRAFGRGVVLRNLRHPEAGADMRVDLALQGPRSREVLLALEMDEATRKRILALKRTQLCEAQIGGFDLVISRTGYTGEKMAFELFVHPEMAERLFNRLLEVGEPYGLKPIGLGARDSLRTEAGLPLYGHEMGEGSGRMGVASLGVGEAGFASYVKAYKPWFIGRQAFIEREKSRDGEVVRFRFPEKGVRMAHQGDAVLDRRGRVIGWVTSCAVDADGMLTGQAFVEKKASTPGSALYIYPGSGTQLPKPFEKLELGERTALPSYAVVLDRFPR